ncbi:hypothetical protein IE077_002273, partial [Cardiosporidium cionae]
YPAVKPGSLGRYAYLTYGWLISEIVHSISFIKIEEFIEKQILEPLNLSNEIFIPISTEKIDALSLKEKKSSNVLISSQIPEKISVISSSLKQSIEKTIPTLSQDSISPSSSRLPLQEVSVEKLPPMARTTPLSSEMQETTISSSSSPPILKEDIQKTKNSSDTSPSQNLTQDTSTIPHKEISKEGWKESLSTRFSSWGRASSDISSQTSPSASTLHVVETPFVEVSQNEMPVETASKKSEIQKNEWITKETPLLLRLTSSNRELDISQFTEEDLLQILQSSTAS